MNIIYKALEYYDKQKAKFEKILAPAKYYKIIKKDADIERSTIIFYDKNNKEIFKSLFENVGNYYYNERMWIWAWGILNYYKNQNYLSRKILNYGLDIPYKPEQDNSGLDINHDVFLKYELTTPRFKIDNYIQLDIHIAICSYLTKIPFIVPIIYGEQNVINKFKYSDMYSTIKNQNLAYIFLLDDVIINQNI